ncbi:hypothetical protein E4U91_36060 [Streptomyces lasalocidi]|uniref:Uncharacterized protein n=1 Tax=Streptomyces lasalocidi TaxID=324833 RepID=A0A4U5W457_STRLS|nr:hypothetical protein E4U91_36060 [Streptomyces lasalocidi]
MATVNWVSKTPAAGTVTRPSSGRSPAAGLPPSTPCRTYAVSGQVVMVTGASSGIGAAAARFFADVAVGPVGVAGEGLADGQRWPA